MSIIADKYLYLSKVALTYIIYGSLKPFDINIVVFSFFDFNLFSVFKKLETWLMEQVFSIFYIEINTLSKVNGIIFLLFIQSSTTQILIFKNLPTSCKKSLKSCEGSWGSVCKESHCMPSTSSLIMKVVIDTYKRWSYTQ